MANEPGNEIDTCAAVGCVLGKMIDIELGRTALGGMRSLEVKIWMMRKILCGTPGILGAGLLLFALAVCTDLTDPSRDPAGGSNILSSTAQSQSIVADFEGSEGTSSPDQFPGAAGGGWAGAWQSAETRADVERSVINTDPLCGNGNYLSIDHTATDAGGEARITRPYQSFGEVDVDADHQIRFDFRLDSADDFNTGNDIIAFFARRSEDQTGAGGTNSRDTWAIRTSGRRGVWGVMDGGTEISTDVEVATGVVYTFVIEFDVATNTYGVTILVDGEEQFTESGLSYRNDAAEGPGTYVHVHSRVSDSGQNLRYSFDSLRIATGEDPGNGNGGSPDPNGIASEFEGGTGTSSSDQFPGSPGDGWASAWRSTQTRASVRRSVADANPLRGNGKYLSIEHAARDTAGVARITRSYESFGDVDVEADHQIRFNFRLDSADDFSTKADIIAFFARRTNRPTGAGGPNRFDTWQIRATGSSGVWKVRDDGSLVTTDVPVTTGVVYTFVIDVDAAANRYAITILVDGTEEFTKADLAYRNNDSEGPGTYIHVHSRVSDSGQNLRYSFDSLRITSDEDPGNGNGGTPDPNAIVARFDGGDGTSSLDQFPGTSGGGWAISWESDQTSSDVGHSVIDASPLRGNGNYLSIDHTATAADGATRLTRRYQSFGEVDTQAGHQIEFDFRLDSADDFNTGNDNIAFFARRSADGNGAGGTNSTDTWAIRASGSDRVWVVRDGNTEIATDVEVTTGSVYTFALVVDGTSNRYDVTILVNGAEQFARRGLGYRNDASDGAGTYLHVHSSVSGSGQNLRYSFDSVRITPHDGPGDGNGDGNGNPDGDRPNEPEGFVAWLEHDFTTLPVGQLSHAGRATSDFGSNYTIVSDASASNGSALRIRYPQGQRDGTTPGRFFGKDDADPSTELKEWYVSLWIMLEGPDWETPPAALKLWYNGVGRRTAPSKGGQVELNWGGDANSLTTEYRTRFSARRCFDCVETYYPDNRPTSSERAEDKIFKVGQWHHLEFHGTLSTPGEDNATVRMWVDGTLVNEQFGVQNQSEADWTTGFFEFGFAPVWGGVCSAGCPKKRDDHMRLGHLYISGLPK